LFKSEAQHDYRISKSALEKLTPLIYRTSWRSKGRAKYLDLDVRAMAISISGEKFLEKEREGLKTELQQRWRLQELVEKEKKAKEVRIKLWEAVQFDYFTI